VDTRQAEGVGGKRGRGEEEDEKGMRLKAKGGAIGKQTGTAEGKETETAEER